MFCKPYKSKSNTTLKNSEKKQLIQRIQNEFPGVSEETAKDLMPVKCNATCLKVTTHSGETVAVFVSDGRAVMLETRGQLLPGLPALWRVPSLLPTITMHSPILAKLQTGVPLYLPGVALPAQGIGFPLFQRGAALALNTQDNAAAAAVGFALLSSSEMLLSVSGVCFETIHVYGDYLTREPKCSRLERPLMKPANEEPSITVPHMQVNLNPHIVREEWPTLGATPRVQNEPRLIPEPQAEPTHLEADIADLTIDEDDSHSTSDSDVPTDMDELLRYCLLSFLKFEGKTVELPIKTSLLYRNHMIPLCPPNRTLEVKKSTYKKVGKFLEAMQAQGLVEVRELERGVDAVTAVNASHPDVRCHTAASPPPRPPPAAAAAADHEDYAPPTVREMFCVTAAVAPLFADLKKGTPVAPAEIRSTLTQYVRERSLTSSQAKGAVSLDSLLATALGRAEQEHMKWDELMLSVQSKMTPCTEMRFADGTLKLTKTKLEPIKMQVATRSGNKKVTLVSNLESFGLSLPALSRACQRGAAAASSITQSPGARAPQLLLQGDQTYFIAKLLIEKYGLPKKYVEGADKALKKKKQ